MSNILNITSDNNTDIGEWEITGIDRINHIPITSSMTMIDASLPYLFSINLIDASDMKNVIDDKKNNWKCVIGKSNISTAENEATVPGAKGL